MRFCRNDGGEQKLNRQPFNRRRYCHCSLAAEHSAAAPAWCSDRAGRHSPVAVDCHRQVAGDSRCRAVAGCRRRAADDCHCRERVAGCRSVAAGDNPDRAWVAGLATGGSAASVRGTVELESVARTSVCGRDRTGG